MASCSSCQREPASLQVPAMSLAWQTPRDSELTLTPSFECLIVSCWPSESASEGQRFWLSPASAPGHRAAATATSNAAMQPSAVSRISSAGTHGPSPGALSSGTLSGLSGLLSRRRRVSVREARYADPCAESSLVRECPECSSWAFEDPAREGPTSGVQSTMLISDSAKQSA